jgi:Mg-chelatase subunit ChlD
VVGAYRRRDAEARVSIIVVSDARANAPASGALAAALHEADLLRACEVETLCVDTEAGRIRLVQAARLARALEADYRHLEECSQRTLGAAVREWMAKAS